MTASDDIDVVGLYRRYFPILLRRCQRVLGDGAEAQEVAQETFVRLWQGRTALRDPARVVGWLYTTSTRLAVDRLRTRRPIDDDAEIASPAGQERVVSARRALARLAQQLDPESLQILVLTRIDGLEQREVAEILGTSERTVRRRVAALNDRLKPEEDEHG